MGMRGASQTPNWSSPASVVLLRLPCSSYSLGIASIINGCTSTHRPCMVVGWVLADGCKSVGEWFARCVGWCLGWLVPPTWLVGPTNINTTHQPPKFQREKMRVSAKPLQGGCVGHHVKKKQYLGVNNKYMCAKKIINNPKSKK